MSYSQVANPYCDHQAILSYLNYQATLKLKIDQTFLYLDNFYCGRSDYLVSRQLTENIEIVARVSAVIKGQIKQNRHARRFY